MTSARCGCQDDLPSSPVRPPLTPGEHLLCAHRGAAEGVNEDNDKAAAPQTVGMGHLSSSHSSLCQHSKAPYGVRVRF